jgi:putative transposase
MKKKNFSETQIVSILKEAQSGVKIIDVCRKYGISDATYYSWKSKYAKLPSNACDKFFTNFISH